MFRPTSTGGHSSLPPMAWLPDTPKPNPNKMATTYKPPASFTQSIQSGNFRVFLAGSIEMGAAPDWQAEMERNLADLDIDFYNPRRDDWDPTLVQSADNPPFREQVEWELDGLALANLIVLYLAPGTMSPISLLELGIYAANGTSKLVVCCPEGFQRKGNVDIICERYGVMQVADSSELEAMVRTRYYNWILDQKNKVYKDIRYPEP